MAVTIVGNNTPTAGGVVYGDGANYASTAAGTAGGVLYSAGSSAPVFSAAGQSGQVLTSAGAGAPTWATPITSALVYLSSASANNSGTVDIETGFGSTYDAYMLVGSNIIVSADNTVLGMRLKIGGVYLSSASYNAYSMQSLSSAITFVGVSDNSSTRVRITSDQGAGAGEVANINIYFGPTSGTTNYKQFYWTGAFSNSTGVFGATLATTHGSGSVKGDTGALTGVRFLTDAGNIASGTFRLYGIVNS